MSQSKDPAPRDSWDKLEILSGLLSSVVIALVGIGVSCSVQRSQIASSEALARSQAATEDSRARHDQSLQESRLTADLLSYLASAEPIKRQLAIRVLSAAVPVGTFEDVLMAIATSDTSGAVRNAALEQLARSRRPETLTVLVGVADDVRRPQPERSAARRAAQMVALRAQLGRDTYFYGASTDEVGSYEDTSLGHGVFTYVLLQGLSGEADLDTDGAVSAAELGSFLSFQLPQAQGPRSDFLSRSPPIAVQSGPATAPVSPDQYARIEGVIVGIDVYGDSMVGGRLLLAVADARAVHDLYGKGRGAASGLELLVDSNATSERIESAIRRAVARADTTTLLVVFYAGHGAQDARGAPGWVVYGGLSGTVPRTFGLDRVNALLRTSRARAKVVIVDADHAFPIERK